MNKSIILTGGGTAGHVTPNLALAPGLKKMGFDVFYIGGKTGMEKGMAEAAGIEYYGISAGKLRRYASFKNLTDPFRVIKGFGDALAAVGKINPAAAFSKGGFVTVPVAAACAARRVPFVLHESDMSPGLANRLAAPFAKKICVTFPETLKSFPAKKSLLTGAPIRAELYSGSKIEGLKLCGFEGKKPVLLCIGGSLGSAALNSALRSALPTLSAFFDIIHIAGKGGSDHSLNEKYNGVYRQFEFVSADLPHLFAAAEVVLSRAGSSAINELLALNKPNLLVPLSKNASRGDQILNAKSFESRGFSMVLDEDELTAESLAASLSALYKNRGAYISTMGKEGDNDAVSKILRVIGNCALGKSNGK